MEKPSPEPEMFGARTQLGSTSSSSQSTTTSLCPLTNSQSDPTTTTHPHNTHMSSPTPVIVPAAQPHALDMTSIARSSAKPLSEAVNRGRCIDQHSEHHQLTVSGASSSVGDCALSTVTSGNERACYEDGSEYVAGTATTATATTATTAATAVAAIASGTGTAASYNSGIAGALENNRDIHDNVTDNTSTGGSGDDGATSIVNRDISDATGDAAGIRGLVINRVRADILGVSVRTTNDVPPAGEGAGAERGCTNGGASACDHIPNTNTGTDSTTATTITSDVTSVGVAIHIDIPNVPPPLPIPTSVHLLEQLLPLPTVSETVFCGLSQLETLRVDSVKKSGKKRIIDDSDDEPVPVRVKRVLRESSKVGVKHRPVEGVHDGIDIHISDRHRYVRKRIGSESSSSSSSSSSGSSDSSSSDSDSSDGDSSSSSSSSDSSGSGSDSEEKKKMKRHAASSSSLPSSWRRASTSTGDTIGDGPRRKRRNPHISPTNPHGFPPHVLARMDKMSPEVREKEVRRMLHTRESVARRWENPEIRRKNLERMKLAHREHSVERNEAMKRWYQENREEQMKKHKAYREKMKEQRKAYNRERYARLKEQNAVGSAGKGDKDGRGGKSGDGARGRKGDKGGI